GEDDVDDDAALICKRIEDFCSLVTRFKYCSWIDCVRRTDSNKAYKQLFNYRTRYQSIQSTYTDS
ncbi:MAG: hypothetical protein ACKPKO_44720, partial [Candidatus Fonsibacter sp.]